MSRAMKDSGIPWIGEIPKEWETLKIKQVMRNKSIKGFPNETVLSLYRDYGVVPKDSRDDNHNVTSEDTSSYKLVDIGDFVINKMKAWQGSMAVSQYRGIISPAYYICNFKNDGVDRRYIHYLLRNNSYKAEYMRLSTGLRVGQWDLNIENFLSIQMVLPPVPEQRCIAEFLDRKCGEIDEAIALQEEFIEELKAYKHSFITEAVTRGLNPNVPMKDSGIEWIGEIPEHWKVTKIKLIAKTNSGSTPKSISDGEDSNIIWIRTTDINDDDVIDSSLHLTKEEYASASCPMLDKGTCVVAMYGGGGTIGKCGFLDCRATINQALCSMEVSNLYYSRYLFCVLKAIRYYWMKFAVGTRKDPNINQEIVKNMMVAVPPLSEQQAIASYLDTKCSEIDSLIALKQQKIEELKDYKKSINYEYVTGKKDVNG